MKRQEKQKLRDLTVEELNKKVTELQLEVVVKKSELRLGKLKNVKTVHALREQIVFIKTIVSEKAVA